MQSKRLTPPPRGVALIEALVALFVLALGLLALAQLQTANLTETRQANTRALAIQLAADLQERIHLHDRTLVVNLTVNPFQTDFLSRTQNDVDCWKSACTPEQRAQQDVRDWKARVAQALPDGDAAIFNDPQDTRQLGVLLAWRQQQSADHALADKKGQEQEVKRHQDALSVWRTPSVMGSGVTNTACPADRVCHLVHLHR